MFEHLEGPSWLMGQLLFRFSKKHENVSLSKDLPAIPSMLIEYMFFLGTNGVDNGILLIALMEVLISEYNLLYWNTLLIYCAELT